MTGPTPWLLVNAAFDFAVLGGWVLLILAVGHRWDVHRHRRQARQLLAFMDRHDQRTVEAWDATLEALKP